MGYKEIEIELRRKSYSAFGIKSLALLHSYISTVSYIKRKPSISCTITSYFYKSSFQALRRL